MLYLIGLGLKAEHITLEALKIIEKCELVYVEAYTSRYANNTINDLEKIIKKKITILDRKSIEIDKVYKIANEKNVALCIFGNISTATTHKSIILEMKDRVKLIPGISISQVAPMITGLEEYKFGRIVSIVKHTELYKPKSFFKYIMDNLSISLHTLVLLDIDYDKNYYMTANEAAKIIIETAKYYKQDFRNKRAIVIGNALAENQIIEYKSLEEISKKNYDNNKIYSLIIPSDLNENEKEFLEKM